MSKSEPAETMPETVASSLAKIAATYFSFCYGIPFAKEEVKYLIMKKIVTSLMFVASVAFVSAQTPQSSTTETKQTHVEHKKTTTTHKEDNPGVKVSVTKKHNGWRKGKHKGAAVKQSKTTTTTTTATPQ